MAKRNENLSEDSLCPDRDSNPEPSKCKSEVLQLEHTSSGISKLGEEYVKNTK
jgi:hypothetical protein